MIKGKAALIVIDVQKDVLDRSIKWFDERNVVVINKTIKLIEACREKSIPVIYTQEVHRDSGIDFGRELDGDEGKHCLESKPTTGIADEVNMTHGDPLIAKRRYSCFLYTDLEVVLNGLGIFPGDTLILCGFFTDVCVHYTFVDAHQRDYRLKVIDDCCGGSTAEAHKGARNAMKYLQSEAPAYLDDILKELKLYDKQ